MLPVARRPHAGDRVFTVFTVVTAITAFVLTGTALPAAGCRAAARRDGDRRARDAAAPAAGSTPRA
ncbi:hypothetical protein [Streptomyces sp. SCL15-4]|uniref:hypothetical protein n=1 Tax=Streptomyces sp. SCL15-4 TaxID=2967221 RepID=UPI0029662AD9|nr:hypothetical protein [Streptomyces sp. SCL15-4]